jgi:hypothetical protein
MPTLAIVKGFLTEVPKLEKPAADVFAKFNAAMLPQARTRWACTDRDTPTHG